MQLLTEASGFLASIVGFLVWLPQAKQVWKDRHDADRLAGISVQTQVLSLAGNALWLVHAIGIGSFWLGAPSVVNIPVILLTIMVVRLAQKPQPVLDEEVPLIAFAPTPQESESELALLR